MTASRSTLFASCAVAFLVVGGCGGASDGATSADETQENDCRTIAPAELSHIDYMCALAAETNAIAEILATVVDQASADRAVPQMKKAATRIKAVKAQAKRLNAEENVGGKGALASSQLPKLSKASRAYLEQSQRIARDHGHLWATIGPALDDAD